MILLANLQSFFKADSTVIDNTVFRLHYKATSVILVAFSIYIVCTQYTTGRIDCASRSDTSASYLNKYCWIHGTFSVEEDWKKEVGNEILYPGIGKYQSGQKKIYHTYYQWVSTVLFLQALLFYVPRYFWKTMEGGKIKKLVLGLTSNLSEDIKVDKRRHIVEYMLSNIKNESHYFWTYVLAEIMNFVNVIGQIFLVDAFLGGEFLLYGSKVYQFTDWSPSVQYDPMLKVFPRLTKCIYYRYASSGDTQRHDAMCLLPTNIVNERIYLFLWFWFIFLSVLSGLALLYRAVIVFWPKSRSMVTLSRVRLDNQEYLKTFIRHCKHGDWFLLDLLSKNLDPLDLRDVLNDFASRKMNDNLNVS